MSSAVALNPRFPNLRPEVVEGYLNAPEHMSAEVLDGELFVMTRPHRRHVRVGSRLGVLLDPFDRGDDPGGWVIVDEPELRLGLKPDIIDPDLAGWRRENVPEDFFAEDAPAYFDLAPDWVCEVLSPSTEAIDRGRKMRIYRRERVGHLWLLDPRARLLEVYALQVEKTPAGERPRYVHIDTFEGDAKVRAEPFDAIELDLSMLWPTSSAP